MAKDNNAMTDAQTPVSDKTVEAVARRHDVGAVTVRRLLGQIQADIEQAGLVSEFDAQHEVKGEQRGVRVWLCTHGTEIAELADIAQDAVGSDIPKHTNAASLVTMAFDREARERYADVFGGRDEAVGGTGHADALLAGVDR